MIIYAIGLAILAALCDYIFGIAEPWRKIIFAGIIVLLVIGLIQIFAPGLFNGHF